MYTTIEKIESAVGLVSLCTVHFREEYRTRKEYPIRAQRVALVVPTAWGCDAGLSNSNVACMAAMREKWESYAGRGWSHEDERCSREGPE